MTLRANHCGATKAGLIGQAGAVARAAASIIIIRTKLPRRSG
jgi:hypothetical protein